MQATVRIKNVYGKEAIYPDNELARNIALIAGTKTLTRQTINLAKKIGIDFAVLPEML